MTNELASAVQWSSKQHTRIAYASFASQNYVTKVVTNAVNRLTTCLSLPPLPSPLQTDVHGYMIAFTTKHNDAEARHQRAWWLSVCWWRWRCSCSVLLNLFISSDVLSTLQASWRNVCMVGLFTSTNTHSNLCLPACIAHDRRCSCYVERNAQVPFT